MQVPVQAVRDHADDQRFLAVPDDRPISALERPYVNIASNGIGVCVMSHMVFPIGTHQCMGPGVPPGSYQGDGDDDGSTTGATGA